MPKKGTIDAVFILSSCKESIVLWARSFVLLIWGRLLTVLVCDEEERIRLDQ